MRVEKFKFKKGTNITYFDLSFKEEASILLFSSKGEESSFIETLYHTISNYDEIRVLQAEDKLPEKKKNIIIANNTINSFLYISFQEDKMANYNFLKYIDLYGINCFEDVIFYKYIIVDKNNYLEDKVYTSMKKLGQRVTGSSLLKEILMSLDLSSMNGIINVINKELSRLLLGWDFENSIPNDEYLDKKKNIEGTIRQAFYTIRAVQKEIDKYSTLKEDGELLASKINYLDRRIQDLEEETQKLKELEKDIIKEDVLKKEVLVIKSEIDVLRNINDKWSSHQLLYDSKMKEKGEIEENLRKINEEIEKIRSIESIENINKLYKMMKDKENILEKLFEANLVIDTISREISQWEKSFISYDRFVDTMINKRSDLRLKEKELENLPPNIKFYNSLIEYYHNLLSKTSEKAKITGEYNLCRGALEKTNKIFENGQFEELHHKLDLAKKRFTQLLERTEVLIEITKIINKDFDEKMNHIFTCILSNFKNILYNLLDYDFNGDDEIYLKNVLNNIHSSINIKDYSLIALSFRLAIIKLVYGDKGGTIVIRDFLYGMKDSHRKKIMKAIKRYSENHQIIYTTRQKRIKYEFDNIIESQ